MKTYTKKEYNQLTEDIYKARGGMSTHERRTKIVKLLSTDWLEAILDHKVIDSDNQPVPWNVAFCKYVLAELEDRAIDQILLLAEDN